MVLEDLEHFLLSRTKCRFSLCATGNFLHCIILLQFLRFHFDFFAFLVEKLSLNQVHQSSLPGKVFFFLFLKILWISLRYKTFALFWLVGKWRKRKFWVFGSCCFGFQKLKRSIHVCWLISLGFIGEYGEFWFTGSPKVKRNIALIGLERV